MSDPTPTPAPAPRGIVVPTAAATGGLVLGGLVAALVQLGIQGQDLLVVLQSASPALIVGAVAALALWRSDVAARELRAEHRDELVRLWTALTALKDEVTDEGLKLRGDIIKALTDHGEAITRPLDKQAASGLLLAEALGRLAGLPSLQRPGPGPSTGGAP